MNDKYKSIINKEYNGVKKHDRMDKTKRAAIFSPFAPLKNNDDKKEKYIFAITGD